MKSAHWERRFAPRSRLASSLPGPGLAVRLLGDLTEAFRNSPHHGRIVVESMKDSGWQQSLAKAAVLLPVKSVGVMGDERTYEYTIAVRIVEQGRHDRRLGQAAARPVGTHLQHYQRSRDGQVVNIACKLPAQSMGVGS